MRIFLSYRRDDTSGHSGRLHDALTHRLGTRNVFQDVVAIAPGVDFSDAIAEALDDCDAVLAVIGLAWVTASTPSGVRRLDQADDYVRLELGTALARDARVIPVLVGGAAMPSRADLPDALQGLADRQAVVLHDETWQQDVDGLLSRLRGPPAERTSHRGRVIAASIALAVIVAAVAAWLLWQRDSGGNEAGTPACPSSEGTPLELATPLPGAEVSRSNDAGPFRFDVETAKFVQQTSGSWLVLLQTVMTNEHGSDTFSNDDYRYASLDVDGHPAPVFCYSDLNPADGNVGPSEKATALVGFKVVRDPHGHLQLRLEHEPAPVQLDLTTT